MTSPSAVCPDLGGEEVGGEQTIGVRLDEVGPTHGVLPTQGGIDAMLGQKVLDGLVADRDVQLLHRPDNPPVVSTSAEN